MTTEVAGAFQKSSYSHQSGDCVEVALTSGGGRVIRDSKNPHGPLLHISPTGWHAFIGAVSGTAVPR
ncbi:DUF397 domain-containing protein [Streptomyces sp. MB09-02B]|uniref:DUF397 domain-containing protein n=1 Tax=Streptomyces sp. MB09-02B TaxID=3028667 RepID=UPI0029A9918C|nr:DUF397 domain-containing protein [Streptomyces sp. MB09-02B]MDX3645699.1 DUF397 domain-containing protein [Streptomyces sp. MB09-02B]